MILVASAAVTQNSAAAPVADLNIDLTATDDVVTLSPGSPGQLQLAGPTFGPVVFEIPSTSLTISGLDGSDTINISGLINLGATSLNITGEKIHMLANSQILTTGAVEFNALDKDTGTLPLSGLAVSLGLDEYLASFTDIWPKVDIATAQAAVEISLQNALLGAAQIVLNASAEASTTSSTGNWGLSNVNASAMVNITDSNISSTGDLTLSSMATLNIDQISSGDANELNGAHGAIGAVYFDSESIARVTGSSVLNAGGFLNILSANHINAAGRGRAGFGNLGGGLAHVTGKQVSEAYADTSVVNWSASSSLVQATANNAILSYSTTSPDGYDAADAGAGADTPDEQTDNNANGISAAGALSYTNFDSKVQAYVDGDLRFITSGDQEVQAFATHQVGAIADGSTAGVGGTGVVNAIAVNVVNAELDSWIGPSVMLSALNPVIPVADYLNAEVDVLCRGSGVYAFELESVDGFCASAINGETGVNPDPDLPLAVNKIRNFRSAKVLSPSCFTIAAQNNSVINFCL